MESMDRSLSDLNVPFICLVEEPLSAHSNSSSNSKYGDSNGSNSNGAGVRSTSGESDIHPTVAALLKFFTALPPNKNPDLNVSASGAKSRASSGGIFALFTDDTYHPLSLFLRTSLVAQLPQMPLFCFDSESIVPPTARHSRPINTTNPTTASSGIRREDEREEFDVLFDIWSAKAKKEDWKFGSRIFTAVPVGSSESRHNRLVSESYNNLVNHLCTLSSCSNSRLSNTHPTICVDLAVVRYITSLESVERILCIQPQHVSPTEETTNIRLITAGFVAGTFSPRRALTESGHGIKSVERAAVLSTKTDSEVSHGELVRGVIKAESSADNGAAVRSYLIEADESRHSCFRVMKSGALSVTRLAVFNNGTIDSTSSSTARGVRRGAWSHEIASVSLRPTTCVKWVVPWLQLLSSKASAILQRPHNLKVRSVGSATKVSVLIFFSCISYCPRNMSSYTSNQVHG